MRIARWTVVAAAVLAGSLASAATLKLKSVEGTVESVQGDKVTVRDSRGKKQELSTTSATRWVSSRALAGGDLKDGDKVRIIYRYLADGSLRVRAIGELASPPVLSPESSIYPDNWTGGTGSAMPTESGLGATEPQTVTGTLERLREGRATLRTTKKQAHELVLDGETRFVESRPLAGDDLKEGARVRAFLESGKGSLVLAIGAAP